MNVSNIFAAGSAIIAAQVNQNFADLAAALSQLRTGNLAVDAGITSRQLAQRFALSGDPILVVPYTAGTSLQAPTLFTPPTAMTSIAKWTERLMGGTEAYICEIEVYANQSTVGGAALYTSLQVLKNGVVIGGGAVTVNASDAYFRLRNADPIANPLLACQDGDVFEVQLAKSDGGQSVAGWYVRPKFKRELVS